MASAWGSSWGVSWGNSWGSVAARSGGTTTAGFWYEAERQRHEREEIRRRKQIATRRVRAAADSGINILPRLLEIARIELEPETLPEWITPADAERIAAGILRSVMKAIEQEEEEILLFLA